jgi:hypothetical protein
MFGGQMFKQSIYYNESEQMFCYADKAISVKDLHACLVIVVSEEERNCRKNYFRRAFSFFVYRGKW